MIRMNGGHKNKNLPSKLRLGKEEMKEQQIKQYQSQLKLVELMLKQDSKLTPEKLKKYLQIKKECEQILN